MTILWALHFRVGPLESNPLEASADVSFDPFESLRKALVLTASLSWWLNPARPRLPRDHSICGRKFSESWVSADGSLEERAGFRKAGLGAALGKPRLILQSSHSVKHLVYPGDCSPVGRDGLSAGPFVMLTAADQWIEVRTSDVGASLEGKKSQRFIFSRLVTLRSLIFSQLASAALKWILISALMQTCQINFADLGYDWPKIASASVLCSKPMNFNHGQNGLVAFFVRNLNRKGLNCKCQGMMLFCSFQKLMWWRSKKLLCRCILGRCCGKLCGPEWSAGEQPSPGVPALVGVGMPAGRVAKAHLSHLWLLFYCYKAILPPKVEVGRGQARKRIKFHFAFKISFPGLACFMPPTPTPSPHNLRQGKVSLLRLR